MTTIQFKSKGKFYESIKCGFEYSLLAPPDYNAYHAPIQCKDFLTDAFWCENEKTPISIYNFNWEPGNIKLGLPWYYMGLTHSDHSDFGKFAGAMQKVLREFDTALGFKRSTVTSSNNGKALLVQFSGAWTKKPVLVSAITQIVRMTPGYDDGDVHDWLKSLKTPFIPYDIGRMSSIIPRLLDMLKGKHPEQTYNQYHSVGDVHACGGLVECKWEI